MTVPSPVGRSCGDSRYVDEACGFAGILCATLFWLEWAPQRRHFRRCALRRRAKEKDLGGPKGGGGKEGVVVRVPTSFGPGLSTCGLRLNNHLSSKPSFFFLIRPPHPKASRSACSFVEVFSVPKWTAFARLRRRSLQCAFLGREFRARANCADVVRRRSSCSSCCAKKI